MFLSKGWLREFFLNDEKKNMSGWFSTKLRKIIDFSLSFNSGKTLKSQSGSNQVKSGHVSVELLHCHIRRVNVRIFSRFCC